MQGKSTAEERDAHVCGARVLCVHARRRCPLRACAPVLPARHVQCMRACVHARELICILRTHHSNSHSATNSTLLLSLLSQIALPPTHAHPPLSIWPPLSRPLLPLPPACFFFSSVLPRVRMVKFGKYLVANQVSEWSSQYVRYKKLKKTIKQIAAAQPAQHAHTHPALQPADAEAFALSSAVWAAHHLAEAGRGRAASESRVTAHAAQAAAAAAAAASSDNSSDIENQLERAAQEEEEHKNGPARPRSLSALKGALDESSSQPRVSPSPPALRSSSFDELDPTQQHHARRHSFARINSLMHVMGPSALNLFKPHASMNTRSSPGPARSEGGSSEDPDAVSCGRCGGCGDDRERAGEHGPVCAWPHCAICCAIVHSACVDAALAISWPLRSCCCCSCRLCVSALRASSCSPQRHL